MYNIDSLLLRDYHQALYIGHELKYVEHHSSRVILTAFDQLIRKKYVVMLNHDLHTYVPYTDQVAEKIVT